MTTGVGRTGFVRVTNKHMPTGYWGRYGGLGVHARLQGDQTIFKMLIANVQKVLGVGLSADLWREIRTNRNPNRVPSFDPQVDQTALTNDAYPLCSCYKETSKQPDNGCRSCYGTGIIPGYEKFGYTEYTVASITPTLTLTNVQLDTTNTAFMLRLTTGSLSGTIVSADMPVSNASAKLFEVQVQSYLRQPAGTSVAVAFSTDGGASYTAIANINTPTPPTAGVIRFRITLTRAATSDKSPFFEILRARHAKLDEPYIRILRGLPTRTRTRDGLGITDSAGNLRWWTVPLRHFDSTIAQDPDVVSPPEDNLIQQKAFIQFLVGALVGQRFSLTAFEYHDPDGIFISQGFSCRSLQPDESESKVF